MLAENPETKEECLSRGRELATSIEKQNQRCVFALENRQEYLWLESLQSKWQVWEQEAITAGIDLETEFGEQLNPLSCSRERESVSQKDAELLAAS